MAASSSTTSAPKPVLLEEPGESSVRELDGQGLRIALVSTRWYEKDVVGPLVRSCKKELLDKGVRTDDLCCYEVPGAYELPFLASRVIQTKRDAVDAVVCIGCMVKGGTMAYEFVSEAVTMGLMKLNVMTDTPVILGLLTCGSDDEAQRCASALGTRLETGSGQQRCNHGVEWAQSALVMARLKRSTAAAKAKMASSERGVKTQPSCSLHCEHCECDVCSCGGRCQCEACGQHKGRVAARQTQTQAVCVGCGQSAAQCDCKGCNCGACAAKQERQQNELLCGGCGRQKKACQCHASHTASGVTTTRVTSHAKQPEREPGVWP
ncbi:hypothetical protein P43SY_000957 [Pythium insidiosum]|uniref:6,7-dimethyl-8-ribityllumazine synthase n=1 Tax=Pythium insidiosum TaxID=114742 RepID=A0AAD5LD36_PYTIN|nr:hypothetical protein P43SY_000957 [Pythium insidiosum]